MIERTIFDYVCDQELSPGNLDETAFVRLLIIENDDAIDGSNMRNARDFSRQVYRYAIRNGFQYNPIPPNDLENIMQIRL